jgi:hypothetical protein
MSEQSASEAKTWSKVARIMADPQTGPCRRGDLARAYGEAIFAGVQYLLFVCQQATPLVDDLVVPVVPTRWGGMILQAFDADARWIDLGDLGPGTVDEAVTVAKWHALREISGTHLGD